MSRSRPLDTPALGPPPSRPPRDREDRTVKERVDVLLDRLDRARDILVRDCSKGDRFGVLALGTLERNLKELVPVIKLIEQSRSVVEEPNKSDIRREKNKEEEEEELVERESRVFADNADNGGTRRSHPVVQPVTAPDSRLAKARPDDEEPASTKRREKLAPESRPLPLSRPDSRISSDSKTFDKEPRTNEPSSAKSSITKFFNRAKETVSPSGVPPVENGTTRRAVEEEQEEDLPLSDAPKNTRRRSVAASDSNSAVSAPSSRRHHSSKPVREQEAQDTDDDREQRRSTREHGSRSRAGRSSSRAGQSVQVRKALEMASAPLEFSEEEEEDKPRAQRRRKRVVRIVEERVVRTIAQESDQATKATLLLVSKDYFNWIEPILYGAIKVNSVSQLKQLTDSFETKPSLAEVVKSLEIVPLDSAHSLRSDPSTLVASLRRLVFLLPNLSRFDEDFTKSEWDVPKISPSSSEYPLVVSSPSKRLTSFSSKRCWWEIGAIHDLFTSQPRLVHVSFGGAAMDREWEGSRLKSSLLSKPRHKEPVVESLEIAQVMHEDTLSVLLLLCSNPAFRSLGISFQSIGPSDDDTPLSSIPLAFTYVSSSLTRLTLLAPTHPSTSRVSEDTSTLLEEVLPLVPLLSHLSFQETLIPTPIPIATRRILAKGVLPSRLKVLRARRVFSISTRELCDLFEDPESIQVLEEIDLEWACRLDHTREEEEEEEWWRAKDVERIREACEDYDIKCQISKGDRKWTIG